MRLDDALGEFNALRLGMAAGDDDVARLDRLAHAAFHAAAHLIVYGSLAPGAPNHARIATLGGPWERGWVEGDREQVGWGAELGYPALRWTVVGVGPVRGIRLIPMRTAMARWLQPTRKYDGRSDDPTPGRDS